MRRVIIAAFILLFVTQSSGTAMAASVPTGTTARGPSLLAEIHAGFVQELRSLQTTRIGAFLIGRMAQYDAMHAPPPDFTEARKPHQHPNPDLHRPVVMPVFHTGGPVPTKLLQAATPRGQHLPPDPRAMAHASASAIRRGQSNLTATPLPLLHLIAHSPYSGKPMTVGSSAGSGVTGINPWWTYEEGGIPGVGKWMVNVATGNLIVQEDDVDVPERGIDLAFRMTYNSMSTHDSANTDGSVPSNYGNGWTNTFDAHL